MLVVLRRVYWLSCGGWSIAMTMSVNNINRPHHRCSISHNFCAGYDLVLLIFETFLNIMQPS